MELTGKVIIFKSEEEAEIWYKAIAETMHSQRLEMELQEYKVIFDRNNKNNKEV